MGFGVGLRVRIWGSVSAGAFSDNGVDLGVPWSSGHVDGLGVLVGELGVSV